MSAKDQSCLILRDLPSAINIRQRYPNCFFRTHSLAMSWLQYFYTYFAFRGSLTSSGFLDRIREVFTVSKYVSYSRLPLTRNNCYVFSKIFLRKVFYCCRSNANNSSNTRIIHWRLWYECAKIWEILRRIEYRRYKRRITLLFILRTRAHDLRGFKSLLAFSFRLDRTEYEREINYTYLYIVSKYGLLHPPE